MSKAKKILIVEDDRFLARSYEAALEEYAFELKTLYDGGSVIETVYDFAPDVILLDILLPKKSGFEVLKELKLDSHTKKIPVVVASNLGQEAEIKTGQKLGAAAYIIKSETSIKDVIKTVTHFLHHPQTPEAFFRIPDTTP